MDYSHFQELRLENFRCFHREQAARLAPLTLLVGENSTGKTSLLSALRAICDIALLCREPNFRESPYDLGSFYEIVHRPSVGGRPREAFRIAIQAATTLGCSVTFKSGAGAAPCVSSGRVTHGPVWIEWREAEEAGVEFGFGSGQESWGNGALDTTLGDWKSLAGSSLMMMKDGMSNDRNWRQCDLDAMVELMAGGLSLIDGPLHASAPIRAVPKRTYDPSRPTPDPQGDYVPTYLASMQFRDEERWTELRERVEQYGRKSGLFDELTIKQFGSYEGSPFQLEVRQFGKRRKGAKRNLIDVGYGVSQALPMLVELFRPDGASMLLLQQPEVHLHPRAQAELGSLFCATVSSGHQLIVETHSDYILDRILLDIRDKRTDLKPDDVSILYFERDDLDVSIHSLRIDDEGEVIDEPDGYRRFFRDELKRVIDF